VRTLLNLVWLVFAGVWLAVFYLVAAALSFVFIVTIPFGVQALKLAGFALWPFGRIVVHRPDRDVAVSTVGNVLWFLIAGWWLVLAHAVTGVFLMLTVIGFPLGLANLKMAGLALAPFGKTIVSLRDVRAGEPVYLRVEPSGR
jgi:uncharacterized membrane protein YccF (DUF307 family)